jgi:ABC-2 type transport system permease protein
VNGFWAVARKELAHLMRDRASLILALAIPIFQVCMYGYAIDFDVRHIPTAVVDFDRSRESREYLAKLHATQYLDLNFTVSTAEEAATLVRANRARVAVIIPPDFSRTLSVGGHPQVGVLLDGSDSQVATRARTAFIAAPGPPSPGQVDARVDVLFNPNMSTAVFMIPGLVGLILQIVLSSLTSNSIVRERDQGSLEQLMVTPVGKYGLMLGKLAPFFVLGLLEMSGIIYLGALLFDVHVAGNMILLFVLSLPFIIASLAIGLLISTIARTQAQALQMSTLIFMPSILMSGFIFPRDTMPGLLRIISNALPLTHQLEILRGVEVRAAGYGELWGSFAATAVIAVALLVVATSKFQKSVG